MKIAATFSLASLGLASAFVESPRGGVAKGRSPPLRMAERRGDRMVKTTIPDVRDVVSDDDVPDVVSYLDTRVPPPSGFSNRVPMPMMDEAVANPERRAPRNSQALPFARCPPLLDGTLAGDAGFDPLGFSDSRENLANYREAEVKHGRLAMLAAAGWPLSELWDAKIAGALGMEPVLDGAGRVPSVLNGGMGKISLTYWLGCVAAASALDVYGSFVAPKREGYVAGDLGFDPLGFYPRGDSLAEEKSRDRMRLSEIKHGRLAMLAITAFAAQEFVSHVAVVDQTPFFFKPIMEVLNDQVPQYYIPPEAVGEAASSVAAPDITATAAAAAPEVVVPAASEAVASVAEAATAAPEAAAPVVAEAVASVAPEVSVPASAEAVAAAAPEIAAAAPPAVAVETLPATPAETADAAAGELAAAQARIVELEAKLAKIDALIR